MKVIIPKVEAYKIARLTAQREAQMHMLGTVAEARLKLAAQEAAAMATIQLLTNEQGAILSACGVPDVSKVGNVLLEDEKGEVAGTVFDKEGKPIERPSLNRAQRRAG